MRYFSLVFISALLSLSGFTQEKQSLNHGAHPAFGERKEERRKMVYGEVANYPGIEIFDLKVLEAMMEVPRHAFVLQNFQAEAYLNTPLPIGYGQTISQPVIVASMTQILNVRKGDKILEIGTGSGYQAAVLAELGAEVFSIEIVSPLAEKAGKILADLGYRSIYIKTADGFEGWKENSPYDKILLTCASEIVPPPLAEQLKTGGILLMPMGDRQSVQYMTIFRKERNGLLKEEKKYPVRFVPMTGKAGND